MNKQIKKTLLGFLIISIIICLLFAFLTVEYRGIRHAEDIENTSISNILIQKQTIQEQLRLQKAGNQKKNRKKSISFIQNRLFSQNNSLQETINEETAVTDSTTENYNNTNISEIVGDCILEIPSIQLTKYVYSGTERIEHLKNYELVTAAEDMYYKNGGNYIICGHASRLYGHSLNRLKEIKVGDSLFIHTDKQTDQYIVEYVGYEDQSKTSHYCNQTKEDIITILSCARYVSETSYIIIKAVKVS